MALQLGWVGHIVFEQHELSVDEIDFVSRFVDFSLNHVVHVLEPGDFSGFLTLFRLSLDLQIVLLPQNVVDFHCSSLQSQRVLVHLDLFFQLLVL